MRTQQEHQKIAEQNKKKGKRVHEDMAQPSKTARHCLQNVCQTNFLRVHATLLCCYLQPKAFSLINLQRANSLPYHRRPSAPCCSQDSISVTWEPHPKPTTPSPQEVRANTRCHRKLSRWFLCVLGFEKHCCPMVTSYCFPFPLASYTPRGTPGLYLSNDSGLVSLGLSITGRSFNFASP